MNTNILITGRGHVANCLLNYFHTWEVRAAICASNIETITASDMSGYTAVVNTAGKTDLAWCEEHPHETFQSNVIAPIALSRQVRSAGLRFIHIGSGCVWDGPYDQDGEPFTPHSPVSPACYYSWTKAACDAIMLEESYADIHILRPRQVFSKSDSSRNTLVKLMAYPKLLDTPNSMTSLDAIATTILYLLRSGGPELINVYNPGVCTPYRVGELLAEAGLRKPPQLLTKDQLDGFHKPKRVDTVLYDDWFEANISPPPIEESLKLTIEKYAHDRNHS